MRNLTLMTDLYQLTMMYGYYTQDMMDDVAVFDLFFRHSPAFNYCVAAGLAQAVEYINDLHFSQEDLEYLRQLKLFDEGFLSRLQDLRFTGDIVAMPEGSIAFPYEPLLRVSAPIFQAQLIETALLNIINHQTLIATKANRVATAACGDDVMEFGLRRAQGPDAGIYGARAAVIGGCTATSNVLAGQMFNIPVKGTHAHSWVMSFPSELEAFYAYAEIFPDTCMLLVDTYDTLACGLPNALKVFEHLRKNGHKPTGIRLDSGDLAYLSKCARKVLDDAGFSDAIICVSGDLDEVLIRDLKAQGACIDLWGVGTKLITSDRCPALGGVYKLSELCSDGVCVPKIKLSDNPEKMTNPGKKKVVRLYDNDNHKAIADLIMLDYECIDETKPLRLYHPTETYKTKLVKDFHVKELLTPIFKNGKQVYDCPDVFTCRNYTQSELAQFWDEHKRLYNPHSYKVDLSDALYDLKKKMCLEQTER